MKRKKKKKTKESEIAWNYVNVCPFRGTQCMGFLVFVTCDDSMGPRTSRSLIFLFTIRTLCFYAFATSAFLSFPKYCKVCNGSLFLLLLLQIYFPINKAEILTPLTFAQALLSPTTVTYWTLITLV